MHMFHLNNASGGLSSGSVVTLGNFDGVHLGHRQLLLKLQQHASRLSLPSVVVTFHPYPHEFFSKDNTPVRLQRITEKLQLLAEYGVNYVLVLRFNQQFSLTPAASFVNEYLVGLCRAKHIIIGDDFRFGVNQSGDFSLLHSMAESHGFAVEQMCTHAYADLRVSSSRVRQALADGDLNLAEALLGRPYSISSRVIYGDQRGREWGFPTVNLPLFRANTPLQGIFVVRVRGEDFSSHGVASIGFRPVFKLESPLLEVFLLDFDRDIYGQRLHVEFLHKLRDEASFSSVDALKEQIQADVKSARAYLR